MNTFFISDTHFFHEKCYSDFKLDDGVTPLRPFANAEEADEAMIQRWNAKVRPKDKVYHLGDIAIATQASKLSILDRLSGIKVLVKGNHDLAKLSVYSQFFKDIRGSHTIDGLILTHIPIHPLSLSRWNANVHGHLHNREVPGKWPGKPDPRYLCVSVERINYTPISLEEAKALIKKRVDMYGDT